jgi:hypothetical protein
MVQGIPFPVQWRPGKWRGMWGAQNVKRPGVFKSCDDPCTETHPPAYSILILFLRLVMTRDPFLWLPVSLVSLEKNKGGAREGRSLCGRKRLSGHYWAEEDQGLPSPRGWDGQSEIKTSQSSCLSSADSCADRRLTSTPHSTGTAQVRNHQVNCNSTSLSLNGNSKDIGCEPQVESFILLTMDTGGSHSLDIWG